jgi:hypothetical protein
MVENSGSGPRLVYLKKLEEVVKRLSGEAVASYKQEGDVWKARLKKHHEDKIIDLVKNDSGATGIYTQLSMSCPSTYGNDSLTDNDRQKRDTGLRRL